MSKKPKQCPKCQSKKILPIMYGMPTEKAEKEAEEGKLIIGGCCLSDESPEWYCEDCQHEFGQIFDPVNLMFPVPDKLSFSIGGFSEGIVFVRLKNGTLEYGESIGNPEYGGGKLSIVPSERKWKNFKKKLDGIDVWSWKKEYHNPNVLDGTQWELEIDYGNQRIKSYGSNLYPGAAGLDRDVTPGFKALLHALGLLLGGVKII